jgi:hypothetical protein
VTEEKLLLFLVQDVTSRPLRRRSRRADSSVSLQDTQLAWRSVRSYVTAATDLYRAQKARGMNSHPTPREDNVREYVRSLQRRDAQKNREQYADKGRDTLLDGYTEEEFERVCHQLWLHTDASPECHLRTLVDLLLGHYMLTRGSDRRAAEISDLFTFEFPGEGPTRCMPLIWTTRAGKQNQHGRMETAGALRSRKPVVCMLGGLAFYLLYRWDLTDEPFPDLRSRSAWYDIRLLKATGVGGIAYNSQRDWVVRAFNYAGVVSHKKTHVGRSSGAKTAELRGVSEEQIRRAGRWNQEQMVGCYLNSLPRKFMRSMAGHPLQPGCFEIDRAAVTPPDELLQLIWPELDGLRDGQSLQQGQANDLAATGLVNLLLYLREVVLQDSVYLRERYPASDVWDHPVFRHAAYDAFAQRVRAHMSDGQPPSQLALLRQAMPVLADFLQSLDARSDARASRVEQALSQRIAAESDRIQAAQLRVLTSGALTLRLDLQQLPQQPSPQQPLLQPFALGGDIAQSAAASRYASAVATPRTRSPSPSGGGGGGGGALDGQQPPRYRMCRSVKTVERLWREWTAGLRGQPSIRQLDSRWGSRWRSGCQPELQWYSLRQEVVREVVRMAQAGRCSEEQAMWALHAEQQRTGCSLDQFCKRLRAARKAKAAVAVSR